MPPPLERSDQRAVLVTGSSRGVGAEVARQLASVGNHVIVNYREKARRAQTLVDEIVSAAGSAHAIRADLSDGSACAQLVQDVQENVGRLDALVLNASGGLERGAAADYPMRINRDAQVRLARLALPLLSPHGRIVFVTSHQAHFYGLKPVPADYIPIAQSKRAGEDALRAMRAEFEDFDVGLRVVSGDMIDGTIIVRLLHRRDPDAVAARRAQGDLPTIEQFASGIVAAVTTPDPFADTTYIGGPDYLALIETQV